MKDIRWQLEPERFENEWKVIPGEKNVFIQKNLQRFMFDGFPTRLRNFCKGTTLRFRTITMETVFILFSLLFT